METPDYRPAERRRGRRLGMAFELVNTFSFSLLAGNLITLLLLRLGAGPTLIGILAAFPYVAFFVMPLAKGSVVRHGLVRTFGRAWTARYAVVIPLVFAPLLVEWNLRTLGIWLVMVSYFMFQMMRGYGLVSISPLNNELSAGKDRGRYLSRKAMVTYGSSIAAGVLVALALGSRAPIERYSLFMGLGVCLGFAGCWLIFRIPEPPGGGFGARSSLGADVRSGLSDPAYRGFFLAMGSMILVASLGRTFLIVYAKQVCHFGDDAAMFLTVIGNLGAIAMGWLCQLVMDRVGAKPLLVLFAALFALGCLPLALLGSLTGLEAWLVLSLLFFILTFASTGGENASQAWFFLKTPQALQFNLGMFYYMVMGAAGALGSFLGGVLLDAAGRAAEPLAGLSGRPALVLGFNGFYAMVFVLGIPVLILLSRIATLGARPVADALSTIFSARDLQTIAILRRLDAPSGIDDEERTLARIRESDSDLAVSEVLKRLQSPLYAIRNQALLILERLPVTAAVETALIDQVRNHQFASAYRAARLLGQKGISRGIPVLRDALSSGDYFLQAWSAAALGDLGDRDSRAALEALLRTTGNHLVLIHCIVALKQLALVDSYPAVLAVLARRDVPPHLRDEVVFGLAGIIGMDDWMYPKYLAFLEHSGRGAAYLLDELDRVRAAGRRGDGAADALMEGLGRLVRAVGAGDGPDFAGLADSLLLRLEEAGVLEPLVASETRAALDNESVRRFIRFRFFVAALAVYSVRALPSSMSR